MPHDPLSNAAVDAVRHGFDFLNSLEASPDLSSVVTDDFIGEDRRRRLPSHAAQASSASPSPWSVGAGRPHWTMLEVIGVRGDRSAAYIVRCDYGKDMHNELIVCVRFDPTLQRLQRQTEFNVDARDQAIAELDRLHGEIDD